MVMDAIDRKEMEIEADYCFAMLKQIIAHADERLVSDILRRAGGLERCGGDRVQKLRQVGRYKSGNVVDFTKRKKALDNLNKVA
jgi:hypothetical protein